jgi:hypothetical protein
VCSVYYKVPGESRIDEGSLGFKFLVPSQVNFTSYNLAGRESMLLLVICDLLCNV